MNLIKSIGKKNEEKFIGRVNLSDDKYNRTHIELFKIMSVIDGRIRRLIERIFTGEILSRATYAKMNNEFVKKIKEFSTNRLAFESRILQKKLRSGSKTNS